MRGFQSTSLNKNEALKFTFRNLRSNKLPVLFEIKFNGGKFDKFYFQLNNGDFTMFPQENEVLIYDGLKFLLEDVNQNAQEEYQGQM